MAKLKKPKEGELITIPIEGKYAVGLVTRINTNKIPLGYFYSTLFTQIPNSVDNLLIEFQNPILIIEFGSQGFKDGTWSIIGSLPNFERANFPVPVFYHHTKPFKPVLVYFDDNMDEIKRQTIDESEIEQYKEYPETGLAGSGFIEKRLKRLITEKALN
jgi:hypothetical protein